MKTYALIVGTTLFQGEIPGMVSAYPHLLISDGPIEGSDETVHFEMTNASTLTLSIGPSDNDSQTWTVSGYSGPQPTNPWVAANGSFDDGHVTLLIYEN